MNPAQLAALMKVEKRVNGGEETEPKASPADAMMLASMRFGLGGE